MIKGLAAQGRDIGKVLDVIRAIAEQTNLLALNAAIERAMPVRLAVVSRGGGRSARLGASHRAVDSGNRKNGRRYSERHR
jgi:hypothetical protein